MQYYLLIINIITFIIYGIDKLKAIKHKQRIREKTLIFLALIGAPLGAYMGMILFHHKTKKKKFTILIPIMLITWIVILITLTNIKK